MKSNLFGKLDLETPACSRQNRTRKEGHPGICKAFIGPLVRACNRRRHFVPGGHSLDAILCALEPLAPRLRQIVTQLSCSSPIPPGHTDVGWASGSPFVLAHAGMIREASADGWLFSSVCGTAWRLWRR